MTKMQAMIVPQAGGRFELVERDLPVPGNHELLIRVQACGVCHSDSVSANGTMMLIGAAGPISINPIELLTKSAGVRGWYSGNAAASEDTLQFSELHAIKSMNEIYPFLEAQAAYDRMMSGKARFRVVLAME